MGVIYVEGQLVTDNVPDGSGYASSINIVKELRDAQNDKSIKAIVLRVDSPGGTPGGGGGNILADPEDEDGEARGRIHGRHGHLRGILHFGPL